MRSLVRARHRQSVLGVLVCTGLRELELEFVYIAPTPGLTWFQRLHDGMLCLVKMLGGMLVFRGIAAAHVAALQAKTQVHPSVSHFQAFLAALRAGSHFSNLIQVLAISHVPPFKTS